MRQYIGARYVTKIYENSQDPSSAEWEEDVNYEPLTLVTFNNGSYLSKKEVPASVGNPADYPAYWVQTGFYNGQIAALQQAVIDINTDIGDLDDLETEDKSSIVNAINSVGIKHYINPVSFGAIGDGVTDDSSAVNAAIDALQDGYGLLIPAGYVFNCNNQTLHNITKDYVYILGGGSLKNATLIIGDPASLSSVDYHMNISNIKFICDSSHDAIQLNVARNVKIFGCEFYDHNAAIRSMPIDVNHGTALINIIGCRFNGKYGIVAETPAGQWARSNDWLISSNIFNMISKIAIDLNGIDGVMINNNVVFFSSESENEQAIKIHGVANNQINIVGNNLFESGKEGIYLSGCKGGAISNNNIVWPGEQVASSGINIDGTQDSELTITGNRIVSFTLHGIAISGLSSKKAAISGNNCTYSSAHYEGSEDLNSMPHYAIYSTGPSLAHTRTAANYGNVEDNIGGISSTQYFRTNESFRNLLVEKSITAATSICGIKSNRDTAYGGGLLILNANPNFGSTAVNAVYILGITFYNGGVDVTEIYKGGYTGGAGASYPSFTFSIVSNELVATPVGSTTGTFYIGIQSIGDIAISEIA